MATYVIGDIQGCYKPLLKLLRSVDFSTNKDELWCVGDLINRGPRSLDTLRYLRDMGSSVTVVLGNHDLHFLALYYGCAKLKSRHTLDDLLSAPDCGELSEWLRHKPLAYSRTLDTEQGIQRYLMIHAGVAPQWSLKKTLKLAAEVEAALQGPDFRDFLSNMYGNTPRKWKNSLTGYARLRVITNYLTRLRFCDEKGRMDFNIKEGSSAAPDGFHPWYNFEQITPDTTILFGHWAALEGKTGHPYVHALDTGCVWGRELTMMRLEDQQLFWV